MRLWLVLAVVACGKDAAPPPAPAPPARPAPAPADAAPAPAAAATSYPDLAAALHAIIPADARVIGFGELHARTDRATVRSALSRFTADALPAIGDQLSDLVVETWLVDPKCGSQAVEATAKIAITTRRPTETKSEIAQLADAARAKQIQPHAMRIGCADYAKIAPKGKDVDVEAMLTLTTRELGRIASEAVVHRDKEPQHRPWIAVYGGALHNDRFPDKAVADWSYAAKLDALTHDHFVEIDLIVPELAEADPASQKQPWFPLVGKADAKTVQVYQRGERSFVVIVPRTTP
ncbi:MAG: hypothetical protein ACM31C_23115 [Acidobacteriota bacterium]